MKKIIIFLTTLFSLALLSPTLNAAEYPEEISKIFNTGEITIEAVKPVGFDNFSNPSSVIGYETERIVTEFFVNETIEKHLEKGYRISTECFDIENCTVKIYEKDNYTSLETHNIKVTYQIPNLNETIENNVKRFADKIKRIDLSTKSNNSSFSASSDIYHINDLFSLNYLLASINVDFNNHSNTLAYVEEIQDLLKSTEFTVKLTLGPSGGDPLRTERTGIVVVYYNEIPVYYIPYIQIYFDGMFFVPSNTEKTTQAYIEALTKRIKEYMPNLNFDIALGGKIDDYANEEFINTFAGNDGNYYTMTLHDYEDFEFEIFIAPIDNVTAPKFEQNDKSSGIKISSSSGYVPLDTIITVEDLTIFKEEIEIAKEKIISEIYKIFDISLFSGIKNDNIEKLDNGSFKVTMSLGKDYENKKLYAYYINDNDELEEYKITMDEFGNATFETNHFSKYIIADASGDNVDVPKTLDNISLFMFLGIISLLSITVSVIYLKKSK